MFDPLARARESYNSMPFMKLLGAEISELRPGFCAIEMATQEKLTQQNGFVHAGAVATIADTAAGYAAYSMMPENSSVLTIEFKINLMNPAIGEKLVAKAKVAKSGRTISVVDVDVFAYEANKESLVAKMQATLMCLLDKADNQPME